MRFLIIILAMIFYYSAQANCELVSKGYHTIADYNYQKNDSLKKYLFYNYIYNPPYLVLNLLDNASESLREAKGFVSCDRSCSVDEGFEKFTTGTGNNFYRAKVCKSYLNASCDHESLARHDVETNEVVFPEKINGKIVNGEKPDIEKLIIKYINQKSFNAAEGVVFASGQFRISKFKHYEFSADFYSSTVTFEKELNKNFYAVFLYYKGVIWYIADSSGDIPCGKKAADYEIYPRDWYADITTVWDYDHDGLPDLIQFGGLDSLYYMVFGKNLYILKDYSNRLNMSNSPEKGGFLQNKK